MKQAFTCVLVSFALLGLAACDSPGTCLEVSVDPPMATCTLNFQERHCDTLGGRFLPEPTEAGFLRCKGEGYTSKPGDADLLEQGEVVVLFKD